MKPTFLITKRGKVTSVGARADTSLSAVSQSADDVT